VAVAEFYFLSFGEVDREGQTFLITRAGRYVDRWERRDGDWKIAYRVVVGEWDRVDPVLERMPNSHKGNRGGTAHEDPVYRIKTAAVGALSRPLDDDDADIASSFARAFLESGFAAAQ